MWCVINIYNFFIIDFLITLLSVTHVSKKNVRLFSSGNLCEYDGSNVYILLLCIIYSARYLFFVLLLSNLTLYLTSLFAVYYITSILYTTTDPVILLTNNAAVLIFQ